MSNRSGRDADARRTIPLNSARWRKVRSVVIQCEPLCRMCKAAGVITAATDVDHVSGDPSDNTPDNLQPLCHECHSRKTAQDHGAAVRWGCDAQGLPIDPKHPWNR